MKPITLTLSAFGPYAKETTLHFDALGTQRLFVITGPTGSGKTTLFEAMLYALYGKLSKRGMDPSSLRCDFLKPDDVTVTYVDFIFEINGKSYKVHRQPKQRVAKKRGSGMREIGQEAILECIGHDDFLPLTKINEVDHKISELVGLDDAQFQKIMMLPQGAFQEFLTSNTKDKLELLRHIFDTSIYDLALQRLKTYVSTLSAKYTDIKSQYYSQASLLQFDTPVSIGEQPNKETLQQMKLCLTQEEALTSSYRQTAEKANQTYLSALSTLNSERQHNDDVLKWQQAKHEWQTLESRKDEMAQLAARMAAAEKAVTVREKEIRANEERQAYDQQQAIVSTTKQHAATMAQHFNTAETQYMLANQEKQRAEESYTHLPDLTGKLEKLKEYHVAQATFEKTNEALAASQHQLACSEEALKNEEKLLRELEDKCLQRQTIEKQRANLDLDYEKLNNSIERERQQFKTLRTYLQLQQELPRLTEHVTQATAELEIADLALSNARAQQRQQLASVLAQELTEGTPCPVCGSVHHPMPALEEKNIINEDDFLAKRDSAQATLAHAEAAQAQHEQRIRDAWQDVTHLLPDVTKTDDLIVFSHQLQKSGQKHKEQMQLLTQNRTQMTQNLDALVDVESKHLQTKKHLDTLRKEKTDLVAECSRLQAIADNAKKTLTELTARYGFTAQDDPEILAKEVAVIKKQYNDTKTAFEAAQQQRETAKAAQIESQSSLVQSEARLQELQKSSEMFVQHFITVRDENFQSETDYLIAKQDIDRRTAYQQTLDTFSQALTRAQTLYNELKERLKNDQTLHDLTTYEQICQEAQNQLNRANDALAAYKTRCQSNRSLIANIEKLFESFKHLENNYALVGHLRDILDGKNAYNMRLETFAQAYYFEQMLAHANVRLARMTGGRYAFQRKDSVHDARRQAGLDLDVMDQYTGRTRDVSTLSGGESFKASLSLALGLADVVSSENGGIELSTIFIDEGFGTLDEESLDETIETLISLQDSGRLVGIISHVAELKERIPAHLVVEGGPSGSHAHFEVRV